MEPEPEFQEEQVQWVFRGPQASSGEDANIVVIKTSPSASNHLPLSFIYLYILIMILACALDCRS
jgi:hypothetical protein